jgi:hypothetical protein
VLKSSPHIVYTPRAGATPKAELDVLAAVYHFVLFDSQASKGGSYGLTSDSTEECTRHDKKGKENADVHGD